MSNMVRADSVTEPAQDLPMQDRKSKIWSVIRVSSGNFLEMYDFMVFGYYAAAARQSSVQQFPHLCLVP